MNKNNINWFKTFMPDKHNGVVSNFIKNQTNIHSIKIDNRQVSDSMFKALKKLAKQ